MWPRAGATGRRTADDFTTTAGAVDIMALLGWLDRAALTECLETEIDTTFGEAGITDAERHQRQMDLEAGCSRRSVARRN